MRSEAGARLVHFDLKSQECEDTEKPACAFWAKEKESRQNIHTFCIILKGRILEKPG